MLPCAQTESGPHHGERVDIGVVGQHFRPHVGGSPVQPAVRQQVLGCQRVSDGWMRGGGGAGWGGKGRVDGERDRNICRRKGVAARRE